MPERKGGDRKRGCAKFQSPSARAECGNTFLLSYPPPFSKTPFSFWRDPEAWEIQSPSVQTECGNLNLPEEMSQQILVGIILVGRLGVCPHSCGSETGQGSRRVGNDNNNNDNNNNNNSSNSNSNNNS